MLNRQNASLFSTDYVKNFDLTDKTSTTTKIIAWGSNGFYNRKPFWLLRDSYLRVYFKANSYKSRFHN